MNLFGAIAAIPAIKNYRRAKADYEALVEKKAAMEASVRTYNQTKYLTKNGTDHDFSAENIPGVIVTPILRFGYYMLGILWFKPSIIYTNLSDKDYNISVSSADNFVVMGKYPIVMVNKSGEDVAQYNGNNQRGFILKAGDTIEIPFDGGYCKLIDPETGAAENQVLWDAVSEEQRKDGVNPMMSFKGVEIDGAVKADIVTVWNAGNGAQNRSYFRKKPGVIFYKK